MFSIIIVNWNGEKLLKECLNSLINSTYKDFKIYMVDNGSSDKSIQIIEEYITSNKLCMEIIKLHKNTGFAYANNIAIDKAMNDESKYIITLNNDIEVKQDMLENLRQYIEGHKEIDIFQLMMINFFERNKIDAAGLVFDENYFVMPLGYNVDVNAIGSLPVEIQGACAGAAVYSKKSLENIKENSMDYFASDFFAYFEDVDLALRLKSKGYKTHLIKNAVVYHMHSATGNKNSAFKDYYLTRNLFKYFNRNLTDEQYKVSSKLGYKIMSKMALKYALKGNLKSTKAILKGFKDYKKV